MAQRFTRREVERHNRADDALLVIDNVVYDVTRFLDDHPGGADILLDNAGKDASKCFHDVGHSDDARLWRQEFRVGEVVDAERRPELGAPPPPADPPPALTLRAVLDVCAPPLLLAGAAAALYAYLF